MLAIPNNPTKNNQNLMLCSLSRGEIMSLLFSIISMICKRIFTILDSNSKVITILVTSFLYVSNYEMVMVMLFLTVDRLVFVTDPVKYPTGVTRKRLMKSLVIS